VLLLFTGYNATVLAYGQTGSGKTYTMGGAYGISIDGIEEMTGIIPRVIRDLYAGMQERAEEFDFVVKISYLEVTTYKPWAPTGMGKRGTCPSPLEML